MLRNVIQYLCHVAALVTSWWARCAVKRRCNITDSTAIATQPRSLPSFLTVHSPYAQTIHVHNDDQSRKPLAQRTLHNVRAHPTVFIVSSRFFHPI